MSLLYASRIFCHVHEGCGLVHENPPSKIPNLSGTGKLKCTDWNVTKSGIWTCLAQMIKWRIRKLYYRKDFDVQNYWMEAAWQPTKSPTDCEMEMLSTMFHPKYDWATRPRTERAGRNHLISSNWVTVLRETYPLCVQEKTRRWEQQQDLESSGHHLISSNWVTVLKETFWQIKQEEDESNNKILRRAGFEQADSISRIDWCCFNYFLRNSLVTLLEALFARDFV